MRVQLSSCHVGDSALRFLWGSPWLRRVHSVSGGLRILFLGHSCTFWSRHARGHTLFYSVVARVVWLPALDPPRLWWDPCGVGLFQIPFIRLETCFFYFQVLL